MYLHCLSKRCKLCLSSSSLYLISDVRKTRIDELREYGLTSRPAGGSRELTHSIVQRYFLVPKPDLPPTLLLGATFILYPLQVEDL